MGNAMSVPDSPSRPVRLLAGITGSAAVIAGGLPLLTPDRFDWIGAAIGLAGAAIAAFVTKWTEGQVTPTANVEVRKLPNGDLVAGEGSSIPTGAPVDVTPSTDTNWVP